MAHHIPGPLYFQQQGATGTPMIFLHSTPDEHRLWLYQTAHFSAWYRTVAVDLAGYGRSPIPQDGVSLADQAAAAATALATAMDYVGTMAVEFFVVKGALLVNELAPRPHNSGHYTLDACATDQFEQQVRALAGLPLGDSRLLSPVAMVNLLGDLWAGGEPCWDRALADSRVHLHLYGKTEPRPGRKMGHLNVLAPTPEAALDAALKARAALNPKS